MLYFYSFAISLPRICAEYHKPKTYHLLLLLLLIPAILSLYVLYHLKQRIRILRYDVPLLPILNLPLSLTSLDPWDAH